MFFCSSGLGHGQSTIQILSSTLVESSLSARPVWPLLTAMCLCSASVHSVIF